LGIFSVKELLLAKPRDVAERLGAGSISSDVFAEWQREAALVLDAPQLSSDAARMLAAAGFRRAEKVAQSTPTEVLSAIETSQQEHTADWLAEQPLPSVAEVSSWIHAAQISKKSSAA